MDADGMDAVCLRVTRACNAQCRFCLAPPRGRPVPFEGIARALRWLHDNGVARVHLCGGEPTLRRDLPEIVDLARSVGLSVAMTTNGTRLHPALIENLARNDVAVKISLHGSAPVHDAMLGVACYGRVREGVAALRRAGVSVSLQTVVCRAWPLAYHDVVAQCLELGIGKLSLMPFVPRGRGLDNADEFALRPEQRVEFGDDIERTRRRWAGVLDIRVIDLAERDYFVVETDGTLTIQRETDGADSPLAHVW